MVYLIRFLSIFTSLLLVSLVGCSSGNRKERNKFKKIYTQKKYDSAIKFIEKSEIKKDKDSKLLYYWEMGKLYHNWGHYEISARYLQKSQELLKQYYTKSITKTASTYVTNDNYQTYDGELFERSLSFYIQSLNYIMMYQTGQGSRMGKKGKPETYELSAAQKRSSLFKARAQILAWDSFFKGVQRSTRYDTVYRNDLLIKLYGGAVHEMIGKRSDDQIALQLYKDAKKLLKYLGSTYVTYNTNYKRYTKQFLKKKNKFSGSIKKNLVNKTNIYKELDDFIDYKILKLTKKSRSSEFDKTAKQIKAKKSIISKVKREQINNVSIVINEGTTVGKTPDKFDFSLDGAVKGIKDPKTRRAVRNIGEVVLTVFMMNVLDLTPRHRGVTYNNYVYGEALGRVAANVASIEFEIPIVKNKPVKNKLILSVHNGTTKVKELPIALIAPLDDMSNQAVSERVFSNYTKTGTRVALKHLTAIIAAYAIYKNMKEKNPLMAKWAATGSYLAAAKGIAASEKADTRHWSTLPRNIRLADLHLKKGTYTLKVRDTSSGKITNLGQINVDGKQKNLFSYHLL